MDGELDGKGATDVGALNAIGIDELADRTPTRLLADWRAASAITRRRFRERDDGEVATQEHANPALRIGHPVEIERIDRLYVRTPGRRVNGRFVAQGHLATAVRTLVHRFLP
jgi:hypothetical protein